MIASKHIYSYEMEEREGHTLLTAQQWPWCVLQVVPTTPDNFEATVEQCEARDGFVATHFTDRTFCIVQVASGDQKGRYPERHLEICGQETARKYLDAVKDQMVQAVVWYYTNVIACENHHLSLRHKIAVLHELGVNP